MVVDKRVNAVESVAVFAFSIRDATQLLDVHVRQFAWPTPFVKHGRAL